MSIETVEYRGYKIEIESDVCEVNVREDNENLGTMVCFHNRYDLGDKETGISIEELEAIMANTKDYISLPLYLYDHSGITMNTKGFSCPWDSGMVGGIFISKEKIREQYSCKRVSKDLAEKVIGYLEGEVELYDQMIRGEVYCYNIKDKDDNDIGESCGGFFW